MVSDSGEDQRRVLLLIWLAFAELLEERTDPLKDVIRQVAAEYGICLSGEVVLPDSHGDPMASTDTLIMVARDLSKMPVNRGMAERLGELCPPLLQMLQD